MRIAVTTAAIIWILITAREVLLPVVVGLIVWLALTAITRRIQRLLPRPFRRVKMVVRVTGGAATLAALLALGVFVAENIAELRENLPLYQANIDGWIAQAGQWAGLETGVTVGDLLARVDLGALALGLAGSTAAYVLSLFVVIAYAFFIFVEAEAVDEKIAAWAGDPVRERRVMAFLAAVRDGVDDFLSVQVAIGLMQAIPTYLLLLVLGVDAPLFFAVVIFLFSFIPTIGTLIGISFPAAMTLVQFGTLGPFLIVVAVLGVVQVVCTNVIAPQMMSRSLNLSPLVILFAVFAGGWVWGIVGALIAVPVLTIAVIACAEQPRLRPVAIALSANGAIPPRLSDGLSDDLEAPAEREPVEREPVEREPGGGAVATAPQRAADR